MRLEGWEARLAAVVESARALPYELGAHDCFRLTCSVVEALTGVDRWPEFAGYRTKREALELLARHGSTFEAAFDWFFGAARVDAFNARRGDVVMLQTADGEKHLGVCNGGTVAGLLETGLAFYPLVAGRCAWRVG